MTHRESGFTIIEVTLVMAIAGLIAAVVLTNIALPLSQQRYNDAVNQTLDFFRGQYAETSNVLNDRPLSETCNGTSGKSDTGNVGSGQKRGASDCLLLGRLLRSDDGKQIKVFQVIAQHDPGEDTDIATKSDTDVLQGAKLIEGNQVATYDMEWGTRLLKPGTSYAATFSILIVRMPNSGVVKTFIDDLATATPNDLAAVTASNDTKFCIDGTPVIGMQPMGVSISKDATNTTGVQSIPSGSCA